MGFGVPGQLLRAGEPCCFLNQDGRRRICAPMVCPVEWCFRCPPFHASSTGFHPRCGAAGQEWKIAGGWTCNGCAGRAFRACLSNSRAAACCISSTGCGVAMDALAAHSVHACRTAGGLTWFDPVASTLGFFRALASTIGELRLNNIRPESVRSAGPSGPDLANLLDHFDRNLQESGAADLAAAYTTAITVIRKPEFRFRGRPLVLLDIVPGSLVEQEMIRALVEAASAVLATAHQRDESSVCRQSHYCQNAGNEWRQRRRRRLRSAGWRSAKLQLCRASRQT